MPVGLRQVEPAVVVGVEEGGAEAQHVAGGRRQADRRGVVAELPGPEVVEERGRLAVEVGHGQVGPAVAVEVAAGDPHARLVAPLAAGAGPRDLADLLEPEAPPVAEQEVGRHVVGDVDVEPAVVVEVGDDDAQSAAVAVGARTPAWSETSTNRPPSLRKT